MADGLPQATSTDLQSAHRRDRHKALEDPDAIVVDPTHWLIDANREDAAACQRRQIPRSESSQLARDSALAQRPETRERLAGKRVLMYCTGGIRCERASALLSELSSSCANGVCPAQATQDAVASSGPQRDCDGPRRRRALFTYFSGRRLLGRCELLFDRRFEQRPLKRQAPLGPALYVVSPATCTGVGSSARWPPARCRCSRASPAARRRRPTSSRRRPSAAYVETTSRARGASRSPR